MSDLRSIKRSAASVAADADPARGHRPTATTIDLRLERKRRLKASPKFQVTLSELMQRAATSGSGLITYDCNPILIDTIMAKLSISEFANEGTPQDEKITTPFAALTGRKYLSRKLLGCTVFYSTESLGYDLEIQAVFCEPYFPSGPRGGMITSMDFRKVGPRSPQKSRVLKHSACAAAATILVFVCAAIIMTNYDERLDPGSLTYLSLNRIPASESAEVSQAHPNLGSIVRTWVSVAGDDGNPCSRAAPCKTFERAASKTVASGAISCAEPGNFGAVTITKALTIDCAIGRELSFFNPSARMVVIDTHLATEIVNLHNILIDGADGGLVVRNGVLNSNNVKVINAPKLASRRDNGFPKEVTNRYSLRVSSGNYNEIFQSALPFTTTYPSIGYLMDVFGSLGRFDHGELSDVQSFSATVNASTLDVADHHESQLDQLPKSRIRYSYLREQSDLRFDAWKAGRMPCMGCHR